MGRPQVLFIADPVESFDPSADSTYVMITEALRRGYEPWAVELKGLSLAGADALAWAHPLSCPSPGARLERGPAQRCRAADFRAILMRKDPPFDEAYLTATWWMDRAAAKTLVLNAAAGLREVSEKLSILSFVDQGRDFVPDTRLARRIPELREILEEMGGEMIVKPLFGFGGREILKARRDDPNLSTLLEMATADEERWTVAQAFIPEASAGDKRVLLVEGEAVGAVLRVPAQGELRNNFHAGGHPEASELSDREQAICDAVGPWLRERGQFFAGIDLIGGMLTEINVTSPTGMQEINGLGDLRDDDTMQAVFWAGIEARWAREVV